ncbi:FAD-dependent monooxygenase [Leptospira saintgironsiae]|uniref:FAD-dependent oxidoreductase n=1 Tax=Leptospira saintgironsiae TaxID=2023183 RepID=A0A2M9Y8K1_9LEPT|nr:FAD-dependent monooxygenase [Leptospira saintgironsiae]PJZ47857.1 FAD-dependent oxidoreductase [Leptospira saintgironsiae]
MRDISYFFKNERPNVVIIGAGPVGILTANLLGLYEIPTLVVDQNPEILEIPRAISLDQDALRILQAIGLGEEAARTMPAISGVEMISPLSGPLAKINSSGSLDGHPRLVSIYQPSLERILRKGLERFDQVNLWSECIYLDHTESDSEIIIRVKCKDIEYRISTGFLLGCDGAHSSVRTQQGWKLQGSSYREDWLILDVANLGKVWDKVEFLCDPKRPVAHVPGPNGSQRWEFLLKKNETKEEMERPGKVAELMKPWGDVSSMNVERTAVYRFQAKTADCMGKGRVYLLGDAAHLTPPFAGQGLVSGMRDAFNLGWKISSVLKGSASYKILSSYHSERKSHAKKMIRLAVFLGSIIMTRNKMTAIVRDFIFKILYYSPLRPFLSDLRIKPDNSFKKGLFLKNRKLRKSDIVSGASFPQFPIKLPEGKIVFSDLLLGKEMMIIGYGKHPLSVLNSESKKIWEEIGGKYCYLTSQQQLSESFSSDGEDITSSFSRYFGGSDRFVIVRPDRIIAAAFYAEEANNTVQKYLDIHQGKSP